MKHEGMLTNVYEVLSGKGDWCSLPGGRVGIEPWFSNLSVLWNHQETLLKPRFLVLAQRS